MKLIVGLGNPGLEYEKTRHNVGFMFVDHVATKLGIKFKKANKLKGFVATNTEFILLKPNTFMNNSGESVILTKNFYKLDLDDILIVYDDLDLPIGKIRIRLNGSSGGQKGMLSIINILKTENIKRLRIGIDKGYDSISHVLGVFNEIEKESITKVLNESLEMVNCFKNDSFDSFMNRYNQNA